MQQDMQWIALCYSVPASPSKARVFVWRRLRALGAQTIRPGLAALPCGTQATEQLAALAEKIREIGGESLLLGMNLIDQGERERLRARFADAHRQELRETIEECAPLLEEMQRANPEKRARLERNVRKKLGKLTGKQHNPLFAQMSEFERTAESLFETLRGLPLEFSAMLRGAKGEDE